MDIQLGDAATWTASALALIFGWMGFIRAGKANRTAADALTAAKRQASSAEKANITADEALEVARRATSAAEDSAAEARRTADLAELSNARLGERNDVVWEVSDGKNSDRKWVAKNAGADTANNVRVILTGIGVDHSTDPTDVQHGQSVAIDLSEQWKVAEEVSVREKSQYRETGVAFFRSAHLNLRYRILWETASGAGHVWTSEMAFEKAQERRANIKAAQQKVPSAI